MTHSIQRHLFLLAGLIFLITWIFAAQISNTQGHRNAQAILEREVARNAELVLSSGLGDMASAGDFSGGSAHFLAIWENGSLRSKTGPDLAIQLTGGTAFVKSFDGSQWVFAERCANDQCVISGAAHTKRHQNLFCLAASIFGPLFFVLLAGFAGMLWAIHHVLKPLRGLADKVSQIEIERPVTLEIDKPAAEFIPLIFAINSLGERVRKLLDRERMFLGSCAHEIRTPLTGLIGQLQLAQQPGLENVRTCAERTARVADQFLTFASSKSLHASHHETERFDLCETLREAIAPMLQDAPEVVFELTGLDYLIVDAHPFAVSTIATNLVQNALKYAHSNDAMHLVVTIGTDKDQAFIEVADNGPGMCPEHRLAACLTFSRFEKRQGAPGAGLGLSIVQEIVDQYRGTLTIDRSEELGGLSVAISLPICTATREEDQKISDLSLQSA